MKFRVEISPSGLGRLSGPPSPSHYAAGSSSTSPMGTSLLLSAPLFCQPPAPPRRQLPFTTWCTTSTVTTSIGAGPQAFQEAESAFSAEATLSLQQLLTSAQQQRPTSPSLARQNSQPISSPDELLSRLNSGQLDSVSSSGLGCICDGLEGSSLCAGSIDITDDDAVSSLPIV